MVLHLHIFLFNQQSTLETPLNLNLLCSWQSSKPAYPSRESSITLQSSQTSAGILLSSGFLKKLKPLNYAVGAVS